MWCPFPAESVVWMIRGPGPVGRLLNKSLTVVVCLVGNLQGVYNFGNTANLLEFLIPPGNTGNLLEFNWSSWKFFD